MAVLTDVDQDDQAAPTPKDDQAAPAPKAMPTVAARRRWVDHPLAAWAIENGSICGIASLRSCIKLPESQSFLKIWMVNYFGGLLLIEGSMLLQKFISGKVYAHIPYFSSSSEQRSRTPFRQLLAEWFSCNFWTHALASGIMSAMMAMNQPAAYKATLKGRKFNILRFLGKLAVGRTISDVTFYCVHRALHARKWYPIHKRHHEHSSTALVTNLHFSVADLFLEGFAPLLSALLALEASGIPADQVEGVFVATYIQWFEIGSHTGKPVPTVTIFPPLAPLYHLIFGNVDQRNIEFHDCHHAYRNCNYGISQWIDYLMGTVRLRDR